MKTLAMILCWLIAAPAVWPATYYVAPAWGNDSNSGTAPTAAVKTLNYALNTLVSQGDTIIISPEYPVLETINLSKSFPNTPVTIFGDCLNTNSFTNLSGAKVPPGVVLWANYANGLHALPPQDDAFDMSFYSNVVMHSLYIYAQSAGAVRAVKANYSRKFYATNCTFFSSSIYAVDFYSAWPDGFYASFDSCTFVTGAYAYALYFGGDGVGSTDWDMRVATKNCIFFSFAVAGGGASKSGSAGGTFGGWRSTNDTWFGGVLANATSTNNYPFILDNAVVRGVSSINHTGQIQFYRSVINGGSGYANNIHLGNSALQIATNNYEILFNLGHMKTIGMGSDDFLAPMAVSPLVGFGSTNAVTRDMYGAPRPAVVTPGALEPKYGPARAFGQ